MTTEQVTQQDATQHANGHARLSQILGDEAGEQDGDPSPDVLKAVKDHEGHKGPLLAAIDRERVELRKRLADLDAAHARLSGVAVAVLRTRGPRAASTPKAKAPAKPGAPKAARPGPKGSRANAMPAQVLEQLRKGLDTPSDLAKALGVDVKKISQTLHALKTSKRAKSTGKRPNMRWSAV